MRFLDLYLSVIPDVVAAGWTDRGAVQKHGHGGRVLEGYLGILNAGTKFGEVGGEHIRPLLVSSHSCAHKTPGQSRLHLQRALFCQPVYVPPLLVLAD